MVFEQWSAAVVVGTLVVAGAVRADTLTLKNGDRLTGTIEVSDGKDVTLKTDFAGEIKVHWTSVGDLKSDQDLFVVLPDKDTISGTLHTAGGDLVVHPAGGPDFSLPMASVTMVRSPEQQRAYLGSLHPALLENWAGGVNLGFALARGNSETTNLNTGFTADRKTLHDEITLYESSLYTRNDQPGGGVTANSILGGAKFDRNFQKHLFGFVSGDFAHDELQDLNLRQIYSAGLGLHAINTPHTTLDLLAGANYTRETYSAGTALGLPVDRNLAGVTLGENLKHTLGKSTTLTEVFYLYPDVSNTGQYRASLDAASVTKINKWLGWQTSLSDRYVTDPPIAGTKTNDVIFSTGINVTFAPK
jgi:putative salt-induced outer membrane protein